MSWWVVLGAVAVVWCDPSPPEWAPSFNVTVEMSTGSGTYNWTFDYFYDYDNRQSRYEHHSGQHDEVCSLVGKGTGRCTVLMKGLVTYINHVDTGSCCKCHRTSGMVLPGWLKGAKYIGQQTIQGHQCDGWLQMGSFDNHYYATTDGAPCLYFENKPKGNVEDPGGRKQWTYMMSTYHTGPQGGFDPPSGCTSRCESAICVLDDKPSIEDINRADVPHPQVLLGTTFEDMNHRLNKVLVSQYPNIAPCSTFTPRDLRAVAELVAEHSHQDFQTRYAARVDNRQVRGDWRDELKVWMGEEERLATTCDSTDPETCESLTQVIRDGRCHAVVMWWVHHMTAGMKNQVLQQYRFRLPLLPPSAQPHATPGATPPTLHGVYRQYNHTMVPCTTCHLH